MISPERLSSGRQRVLALAVLLLLVVMTLSLLVLPYKMLLSHYDDEITRLSVAKRTYSKLIAQGSIALAQRQELERAEALGGYFIASSKSTLASADLQRRVKMVIEQSGGSVVSSQMLGERIENGMTQVVLRVQLRSTLEQLSRTFYEIEGQRPVAIIDNLYIGARPSSTTNMSGTGKQQYMLDARFDVIGFIRPAQYVGVSK